MNRTEDDLRTLLQLPVEAEVVDRVMASTVRTPRSAERAHPRRPGRIGLVAALAVVLVVGVAVAVVATRPAQRSAVPPAVMSPGHIPLDAVVIGFAEGSGLVVTEQSLRPDGQSVTVSSSEDPTIAAKVFLGEARDNPYTPLPDREPVDVGGVTARWYAGYIPGSLGPPQPDILQWESNGFAFGVQAYLDEDETVVATVARAVRVVAPVPVRVPFAVRAWPADWRLAGVATAYVAADPAVFQDRRASIGIATAVVPHTASGATSFSLDVRPLGIKGDDERGTPVVIAGRTWRWNTNSTMLTWHGPDRVVSVGSYDALAEFGISTSELTAFVADLSFSSSFSDESTWFDATSALPS